MSLIYFHMNRSIVLTVTNPGLVYSIIWGDHIGRKFTGNADLTWTGTGPNLIQGFAGLAVILPPVVPAVVMSL